MSNSDIGFNPGLRSTGPSIGQARDNDQPNNRAYNNASLARPAYSGRT